MSDTHDRIRLHAFGSAKLLKRYPHRETKEIVWEVFSDSGQRMHLSQRYVDRVLFDNSMSK